MLGVARAFVRQSVGGSRQPDRAKGAMQAQRAAKPTECRGIKGECSAQRACCTDIMSVWNFRVVTRLSARTKPFGRGGTTKSDKNGEFPLSLRVSPRAPNPCCPWLRRIVRRFWGNCANIVFAPSPSPPFPVFHNRAPCRVFATAFNTPLDALHGSPYYLSDFRASVRGCCYKRDVVWLSTWWLS